MIGYVTIDRVNDYNSHYIAHTDPIFKKLHMVKIIAMFRIAV